MLTLKIGGAWFALVRNYVRRLMMDISYQLVGILILILDIWVIINILKSGDQPIMKLVWILIVLLLPLIGPLLWLVLRTRA